MPSAMAQAQDHTTIDLTLDDDEEDDRPERHSPSPSPSDVSAHASDLFYGDNDDFSDVTESRPASRAPIRTRASSVPYVLPPPPAEVIDITGDEDEQRPRNGHRDPSSDIEFLSERAAPRRPVLPVTREIDRRLRTPPELRRANAQTFTESLRNPLAHFWNRGTLPRAPGMGPFTGVGLIDQVNRIMGGAFPGHRIPEPLDMATYDDIDVLGGDYDDIQMDYGAPAFEIIDPGLADRQEANGDNYKAPKAAREGFTRDIHEEEDALLCAACDEELAVGEDENDIKAQVWVSKRCGHVSPPSPLHQILLLTAFQVYCGGCASTRVVYRQGNDRDRKRAAKRVKQADLKGCPVEGCAAKLTGKTALFQVYL